MRINVLGAAGALGFVRWRQSRQKTANFGLIRRNALNAEHAQGSAQWAPLQNNGYNSMFPNHSES
jgi:hypothetical protein